MRPFAYLRPSTAHEALAAIGEQDGAFLGGGTNLVDLMRLGVAQPGLLVDVTRALSTAVVDLEPGVRVGAGARNSDVAADALIRTRYPVLSEALLAGASGQLRNMATVGGNLLQRTRCRYFQDVSVPCNKRRPGSGCPAIEGEHHNLAILGSSPSCVATHSSDMAVALSALDAVIELEDALGSSERAIHELYRLPGGAPERDTTLERTSLITSVRLDDVTVGWRGTYQKVRERASFAFALVSAACLLCCEDDVVRDVRICLGGVAHRPWRAWRAEEALRGRRLSEERCQAAMAEELADARPLRDNGYKVDLSARLVTATLLRLGSASDESP